MLSMKKKKKKFLRRDRPHWRKLDSNILTHYIIIYKTIIIYYLRKSRITKAMLDYFNHHIIR